MIRVIVCDDQDVVCQGLSTILNNDPEIEVIAVAHDGQTLLDLIPENKPDLVLLDLKMPGMNGVQAARKIRQSFPSIHIVILTTYDDDEWLFDALHSGVQGYLLKDTSSKRIIDSIKGTMKGETFLDPAIAGKVLSSVSYQTLSVKSRNTIQLSERETEILGLMARGLTNADIARELFLSEGTVRNYASNLFSKLGVSDRTQAVIAGLRQGLVDIDK
jgi:DNA-binding NarL/FixJ family response regulator